MRVLRIAAGILLGYVVSVAMSLAWFYFTHGNVTGHATRSYKLLTAIWCVLEGIAVGSIAAAIGGSRNSSFGVAVLIVLVTVWAGLGGDLRRPLWSLEQTLLLLAPFAALGYLLPLPGTRKVQA